MLRLKELRTEKNISQEQLAQIIHVKNYTIGNWEQNRAEPSIQDIIALANYFEVSTDYLLGREDYATGNVVVHGTNLSTFDERLLQVIHLLAPEDQYQVLGFAQALAK